MGKYIGKIVSILMIWFAFHDGALIMRNLSEFTTTLVFDDTPASVPMICFAVLLIWGLKAGIEVLGRWSEFFIFIVIMVFSNIAKTKNYKKIFILGLLIGGGLVFLATLRNLLILGSGTISRLYYPSTMGITLIRVGELLERLEMFVTIDFLVCVFVKVCICIYAVCNGILIYSNFIHSLLKL